jgi:CBS-domain-containing membrane protein
MPKASRRLTLEAATAADLMTPNPLSIRDIATLQEAVAFLVDHGFSAAPVIDGSGKAVGVLSQSDLVIHDRQKVDYVPTVPDYYARSVLKLESGEVLPRGFLVQRPDKTRVRDLMTPVIFAVKPQDPAGQVVHDMLNWKVHRLFVVDEQQVLVGVISALDILRRLG